MSTTTTRQRCSPAGLVALGVVALVGALVAAELIRRWRLDWAAANEIQAVMAELDESEPGWRLEDIEAAREAVPEGENSARVVAAIGPRLPFSDPPLWQANWRSNERFDEEYLARLRKPLAAGRAHCAEARRLADLPRGRFDVVVDHTAALSDQLGHHPHVLMVGNLLVFDAVERAHAGDINGALASCRAAMNAARSVGDEPLIWPQIRRFNTVARSTDAAAHSLALGVADEKSLADLQRLVALELPFDGSLCGWRGKRAALAALMHGLADGTVRLRDLPKEHGGALRHPNYPGDRLLRKEQVELLRFATRIVENARLPMHEQAADEKRLERVLESGRLLLAATFFPSPHVVGHTYRSRTVTLGCLMVLLAAERYRLKHNIWPERLDDLKPEWLKEIPVDPHDGKPLRFKKVSDGVVAYSVGYDGVDNGGVFAREQDQGYRLWDVDKRNQPARPPVKKAKK